ncbi:MAG: malate dehydrogenase [archaeon]
MHIAQIGTGRVGRPTAYTILCSKLADRITVCDIQPELATAFAEELRHVAASLRLDVEIISCETASDVVGADIILISAGKPRTPGVKMTRRDLAIENGRIVKQISQSTILNNPLAKYVVITNPVDAMAMVCKKYSDADFVISTGTNLESLRFRSRLAQCLKVPVSEVDGYVGGEHGTSAVILWSTVKVYGVPLDEYLKSNNMPLDKNEIDSYMKSVSKQIVDNIGGTEYGPAASFTDIVRAIINDSKEILPVAVAKEFEHFPQPVFVSVPLQVGNSIGSEVFELSAQENEAIREASEAIYQTFKATTNQ